MIDFRYHIVSIVSIFLALAVGIVLGAGPLQGQIGDTLSQEVTQLRNDRAELRSRLDAANRAIDARDSFEAEVAPTVVAGRLTGRSVAIVELAGANENVVKSTVATLEQAGATIASTTTVTGAWTSTDDDAKRQRQELGASLMPGLGLNGGTAAESGEPIDRVLAATLVTTPNGPTGGTAARRAYAQLVDAKLIEGQTTNHDLADVAVVLTGPLSDGESAARAETANRLVTLTATLDLAGRGTVLASDIAVSDPGASTTAVSVVRTARRDAAAMRLVSTVDDASVSLGQVSIVNALVQQIAGGVGQYGLDSGVTAPYAPVR